MYFLLSAQLVSRGIREVFFSIQPDCFENNIPKQKNENLD
jgi:hypothetical protein